MNEVKLMLENNAPHEDVLNAYNTTMERAIRIGAVKERGK